MTTRKPAPMKRRKDIGEVEFPIEKLQKFRDAEASCVHIEARMEAGRGLTDPIKGPARAAATDKDRA